MGWITREVKGEEVHNSSMIESFEGQEEERVETSPMYSQIRERHFMGWAAIALKPLFSSKLRRTGGYWCFICSSTFWSSADSFWG